MGARFASVGVVVSAAWYGWRWLSSSLSFGGAVLRVLACAFMAAGFGKVLGVLRFRAQARRSRVR